MSPLAKSLRAVLLAAALPVILAGCSSKRDSAPFDPDVGHGKDFFGQHGAAFRADSGTCTECHGADLLGGISKVSCSSVSYDGQACHPGGPGGGHPPGWANASGHGAGAKTPENGFAGCQGCHGGDFRGGGAGLSCFGCHGVSAPHPRKPWRGSLTHTTTNPGNASICAGCHRRGSGTPGCFNSTLCHGEAAGHPAGWDSAGQHGNAAKRAPGTMSGFASCEVCHGSNFAGGSGPSCFPCHGWNAPHARSGWDGGGPSHTSTDQANASVCAQCHRRSSGTPGCFNGTLCHSSAGNHPAGWSSASLHGSSAKGSPGMASCQSCHGSNYAGGSSGQSCFPCHGWNAPHARNGWDGGAGSHRSTSQSNAAACAQCHRRSSGTPGCFNNTLCHGRD